MSLTLMIQGTDLQYSIQSEQDLGRDHKKKKRRAQESKRILKVSRAFQVNQVTLPDLDSGSLINQNKTKLTQLTQSEKEHKALIKKKEKE